ncbi:ATP-binding cassette domain-containing protein [Aurantimonas sp. MSK8Z-1]|uniref:ABC transporter ATP-binding protein n=1 Tax=Mangrovibrevibacter kandeliae TaxID=2968473 RepID=UPI002117B912|nr:ABC transporter ATP-binding protein [Aurantimonas sp. MSK8Z-1]MCW4116310.1 ATP-binding cassette domain-containing protein [Aurantimonas sp. MSK8Z-1]
MTALLALDDVTKTFGYGDAMIHAARGVSFELKAGRALAVVGESGSGKTTCARLVMRDYAPDGGKLVFRGKPMDDRTDLAAYRRAVQMIFQDPFASLNPAHTIRHHLRRPLRLHRPELKGAAIDAEVLGLLRLVQLDPERLVDRHPFELSGGQRQRINIARALAVRPEVLVADEPTSMLDVSVRLGVLNLLNAMKREMRLGLLYITHDIATARYVAEDIAVMYAGQILEWGATASVIDTPAHPYTRLLLSAVPDPQIRFADPAGRLDPDAAAAVRQAAAVPTREVREVGPNHFVRALPG